MERKPSRKDGLLLRPACTGHLQTLQIHHALSTTFVGRTIYLFAQLESTNKTALKMAEQLVTLPGGGAEGTLVLAEAQSQGRGRLGRRWISPPSVNLYASLILRPRIPAPDAPVVTCLAATSVAQAIRAVTGLEAVIKWPNDILIHDRKVSGILTELGVVKDQVNYLVIGIGINVNLDPEALPDEIRATATSLMAEAGQEVDRNELMATLCNKLEERYLRFLSEGSTPVLEEFRSLTITLGRRVK
ncbi:MAG: biotin--[acetyl-CoA-carboxylase] ligase, partial [Nitrospiria bacterium]